MQLVLIDNFDSFTYNLVDYFFQTGETCTVIRNNNLSMEKIKSLEPDGIIISPGPETPGKSGKLMQILNNIAGSIPILGICLGHQAIGELYGAKLIRAANPMHGKTSIIKHNDHISFSGLPSQINVMRYHSLVLKDIEITGLIITAKTIDEHEDIMALAHPEELIWGFQFHPESILTTHGLKLLRNWRLQLKIFTNKKHSFT